MSNNACNPGYQVTGNKDYPQKGFTANPLRPQKSQKLLLEALMRVSKNRILFVSDLRLARKPNTKTGRGPEANDRLPDKPVAACFFKL
jgi:hypothetical protein